MIYIDDDDFELTEKLEILANTLTTGCQIRKSHLRPTKHDYAESLVSQGLIAQRENKPYYTTYIATERGKDIFEDIAKYASNLIK